MASTQAPTWARDRWLLRFPWDWPDAAWDVARVLVDHWEGASSQVPFVASNPNHRELIDELARDLVTYRCARGEVPTLAPGMIKAVALCLEGNRRFGEALGLTSIPHHLAGMHL